MNTNFGHDITRANFARGHCLFQFDLCSDFCIKTDPKGAHGLTRLSIRFAKELPEPVNVIIFAKFPVLMTVDKTRNIVVY